MKYGERRYENLQATRATLQGLGSPSNFNHHFSGRGFEMSLKLSTIKTTCQLYDQIVEQIQGIHKALGPVAELIEYELTGIETIADEMRCIAGDLRDTASDIAVNKNYEIDDIQAELDSTIKVHQIELDDLRGEIELEMEEATK